MITELQELEEQLREVQLAKIRNTDAGIQYFKQMQKEVELLKRIGQQPEQGHVDVTYTLWREKHITFLRDNYGTLTNARIGQVIGRTEEQVRYKIRQLGLTQTSNDK